MTENETAYKSYWHITVDQEVSQHNLERAEKL